MDGYGGPCGRDETKLKTWEASDGCLSVCRDI